MAAAPRSIAILLRSLDLGGAQVAMMRLAAQWVADGHAVAVIVQNSHDQVIALPAGVALHVLGVRRSLAAFLPLLALVRARGFDILLSSLPHASLLGIAACRLSARTRIVVVEHAPVRSLCAAHGGWRYRLLPILLRLVYPLADAVVGVSEGITQELRTMIPRARHARCIYNPVVSARLEELSRCAGEAVRPPGWAATPHIPVIIACGRLAPEKDFATLLDAVALLRRRRPARLLILGEGELRAELQARADRLGFGADCVLQGYVTNPYPSMRAAAVLALTSRFEGFGIVLVEAMACGTPVVATDAPFGPREILADGRYGRLVQIGNAEAFADALHASLSTSPDSLQLCRRAALFSVQMASNRYLELFDEVHAVPPMSIASAIRGPALRMDGALSMDGAPNIPCSRPASPMGLLPDGRPMRVAVYLHDMAGGGAERMRINLIQDLRRAGAEVDLVLHARRGELLARVPADVRVIAFDTGRTIRDLLPLAAYLRRERPDILLSSLNHNNVVAALAGMLAGGRTRVILTQHNALSQEAALAGGWKYRIMPNAYRFVSPLASGIVAVSAGVAQDMADVTGIDRGRITVIYNPVVDRDLARRADAPLEHPWFGPAQPPVFITAGRLVMQKDHATLLRAFAIFRGTQPARLMILGGGPMLAESQRIAVGLGIEADVAFLGFQDNPLPYYRRACAFVLSSRYEGFGNVLVEALACGLPVVSTDCPHGPAEILAGGRYGALVPVGDPAALAAALSPTLRTRFSAAMLQARAQMFTADEAARAYLGLMRGVLGCA